MAINLIESIQKNLGYPELHKIDPNTQEVKGSETTQTTKNPGQSLIPAVLMGIYYYGSTELGAEEILRGNKSTSWLETLFAENKEEAITKVSEYAGDSREQTTQEMNKIANEAVRLIRENVPSSASFGDVKTFLADQRKNILVYLPAELQIGSLLHDNTLDDRTNKMEGPLSNHMHFFEKLFSGSTTEKNEKQE